MINIKCYELAYVIIMVDLKILRGSMRHDNAVSEMMRAIISYENI